MNTLIASLLLSSLALAQSTRQNHIAYTPCQFPGLSVVQIDALPATPMVRTIETPKGEQSIVMVEGYRIMYLFDPDEPLLNMKAERLEVAAYAAQKSALIDNLEMLSKEKGDSGIVTHNKSGPIDSYSIARAELTGGVLSISESFDDRKQGVTTVYFLNDDPERRHFKTLTEFLALRDRLLTQLVQCLAKR